MANQQSLDLINQGVEAWNASPAIERDLSNADLRGRNLSGVYFGLTTLAGPGPGETILTGGAKLTGADLRDATLSKANLLSADLSSAHLEGADLSGAVLVAADLSNAHLERANLSGATFSGPGGRANLQDADLREAILHGCDLSGVKGGLRPQQLAGADLTGATLPQALADLFKELGAVGDISESARKLFVAMLAACLYSWLTIATTTDVNLITNRASSPLPIIQTSIPIVGFYVVAPLLLLCVYFYFHFYLQKLWEELGSLPAIFPDGRCLHEKTDPWLLNDLVRAHVTMLKGDRPFMSYFQQAISIVLAWWLVPITLFFFWGRYLPRHDFRWTTLQVLLLAIAITGAVRLYRLAAASLLGRPRRSFSGIRTLRTLQAYGASAIFVVTGVAFMLVSIGAIRGVPPGQEPWWSDGLPGRWGWVPRAMALVHYSPFANLTQADVSVKPPNWTGKNESELDLAKGAELAGADLRYADASGAFLPKANLQGARLEGARLTGADLTGALLRLSDLTGADLAEAKLAGADLLTAKLNRADLSAADLTGASLTGADLRAADLINADLRFADFRAELLDLQTTGLAAEQLEVAKNWDKAYYDDDLLKVLFPEDWRGHTQKLAEEEREEQKGHPAASVPASNASRSSAGKGKSANVP